MAALIDRTWADPASRPSFSEIIDILKPLQHGNLSSSPAAPALCSTGASTPSQS